MKLVYTGGEKVAEFESYDELRVGANNPAFIYEGNELVYPNPVKDGLILWYDFSGRTNDDAQRDVAEDLSGNGNHGTLQNFNYTAESGYQDGGLKFDGVDDEVHLNTVLNHSVLTVELTVKTYYGVTGSLLTRNPNYNVAIWQYSDTLMRFRSEGDLGTSGWRPLVSTVEHDKDNHYIMTAKKNGTLIVHLNGEEVINYKSENEVGNLRGSFMLSSNVDYSSLKLYDRPLTPEEIQHNYAIEKDRFGIE